MRGDGGEEGAEAMLSNFGYAMLSKSFAFLHTSAVTTPYSLPTTTLQIGGGPGPGQMVVPRWSPVD
jgi:hypothetical protein